MITLALLLQAAAATTVGDTVWLDRTVSIASGQIVQPPTWTPEDPIEALGPPILSADGGRVTIRYPVVIWRTGRHRIEIPGPVVIGRDGGVDTLPASTVTLEVASVLPASRSNSSIPVQPEAGIVPLATRSPWPLFLLIGAVLVALVPAVLLYRRRGKRRPAPRGAEKAPADFSGSLERWADAGERRAVASAAALSLRAALAAAEVGQGSRETAAPTMGTTPAAAGADSATRAECHAVLEALDVARFGADAGADIPALVTRARRLERQLTGRAP